MRISSNKLIYAKLFILFIILFYSCNLDFMPGDESTCLSLNRCGQTAWGQHTQHTTVTAATSVSVNDELSEAKSKHQTASWSPPVNADGGDGG